MGRWVTKMKKMTTRSRPYPRPDLPRPGPGMHYRWGGKARKSVMMMMKKTGMRSSSRRASAETAVSPLARPSSLSVSLCLSLCLPLSLYLSLSLSFTLPPFHSPSLSLSLPVSLSLSLYPASLRKALRRGMMGSCTVLSVPLSLFAYVTPFNFVQTFVQSAFTRYIAVD